MSEEHAKDQDRAFVKLIMRHDRAIRAFLRSLLPTLSDVDDVMQEVSVIAWRKFDQLDDPENFPQWVGVIARYEVLKHLRSKARDQLLLGRDIEELMAVEGLEEIAIRKEQLAALQDCLNRLPARTKKVVLRQLDSLRGQQVGIADLSGARLGEQYGNTISLDINAAGHGWFVSPESRDKSLEPPDSDAYSDSGLSTSDSRLRIDLLTVLFHEMGHALGLEDDYSDPDSGDIMNGWLPTGTRRLPSVDAIDLVLADQHVWDDEFTS